MIFVVILNEFINEIPITESPFGGGFWFFSVKILTIECQQGD